MVIFSALFSMIAIGLSVYTLREIEAIMQHINSAIAKTKDSIEDDLVNNVLDDYSDLDQRIDALQNRMDQHYRWSLGIWNDIASPREAMAHPMPETLNDTLTYDEVYSGEVSVMGPRE